MENNTAVSPIKQHALPIINGQMRLDALDLENSYEFEVAMAALHEKPALVKDLSLKKAGAEQLIAAFLAENRNRLAFLDKAQYTPLILGGFLANTLIEGDRRADLPDANGQRRRKEAQLFFAYDAKPVLLLHWQTCAGEAVRYFDPELQIPVDLISDVDVRVKIENALDFLRAIDIEPEKISYSIVLSEFNRLIYSVYRNVLYGILEKENVGYYGLTKYFAAIEEEVQKQLERVVGSWGVSVKDVSVRQVRIPGNTSEILEDQFFQIRKETRKKNFEQDVAEMALKNYERKAEIHSKYPAFELTLTEAEKDYALDRYLKKTGRYSEEASGLKRAQLGARRDPREGRLADLTPKPVPPVKPEVDNSFRNFILLLIVCVVGSCLVMIGSLLAGFILLACTAAGFGLYATFRHEKLNNSRKQGANSAEYREQSRLYQIELEKYERAKKNREGQAGASQSEKA